MRLDDYNYLWTTERKSWVLVNTKHGYAIVNKDSQTALLVCCDELADALIAQMLKSGNKVYENINEAYADSEAPDTTIP